MVKLLESRRANHQPTTPAERGNHRISSRLCQPTIYHIHFLVHASSVGIVGVHAVGVVMGFYRRWPRKRRVSNGNISAQDVLCTLQEEEVGFFASEGARYEVFTYLRDLSDVKSQCL